MEVAESRSIDPRYEVVQIFSDPWKKKNIESGDDRMFLWRRTSGFPVRARVARLGRQRRSEFKRKCSEPPRLDNFESGNDNITTPPNTSTWAFPVGLSCARQEPHTVTVHVKRRRTLTRSRASHQAINTFCFNVFGHSNLRQLVLPYHPSAESSSIGRSQLYVKKNSHAVSITNKIAQLKGVPSSLADLPAILQYRLRLSTIS
jgi:hypothetical protein